MTLHRRPSLPAFLALAFAVPHALAPQARAQTGPSVLEVTSEHLAHRVTLGPGERLLGYAFDGAREIPWFGPQVAPEVVFGTTPPTASTRALYCFEGAGELQAGALGLAGVSGTVLFPGRRGRGLAFRPDGRVEFLPGAAWSATRSWTVEFWLRPGPFQPGASLLELAGVARLTLRADGFLEAALATPGSPRLLSAVPLVPGRWAHVGLSLDALDLDHLRLTVDDRPAVVGVAGFVPPAFGGQVLLGDGAGTGAGFFGILDEFTLRAHASASQEMVEHGEDEARPGPHTLALRTSLGTRSIDLWHRPSTEALLDTAADFAQGVLDHAVYRDDALILAGAHWEKVAVGDAPAARTTHPSVHIGGERVLIYGGETRDTQFGPFRNTDDTWILDAREGTWTRVDSPTAPSPRCHQSAAYSPDHDVVLYFGGFRNDTDPIEVYGDTWLFDVASGTWQEKTPAGHVKGLHSDDSVYYHPLARVFVMFHQQRVLTYDPSADRWEQLASSTVLNEDGTPLPGPFLVGGSAMSAYDPVTNRAVVFGGSEIVNGVRTYLDVTYLYQLETNTFTVLAPPVKPAARVRAAFAYDGQRGRAVLFGGVLGQFSQRFDDLWSFDFSLRRWTRHDASNAPDARGGYFDMAYVPSLDRFFLPCGRRTPQDFLNETWSLDFSPAVPGRSLQLFDRAGFGDQDQWSTHEELYSDARIEHRFRASFDGRLFGAWTPNPQVALAGDPRYLQVETLLFRASDGARPRVRSLGFVSL